jgi:hypothetical protein
MASSGQHHAVVGRRRAPLSRADRLRRAVNLATLATPAGLLLARLGGARLRPGPRGTLVAAGYRSRLLAPRAAAITVGDVILLRLDDDRLARRPGLLDHEAEHATQWACALGMVGFPLLYGLASAWSWLRFGDAALGNPFERRAGLVTGGYLPAGAALPSPRWLTARPRRR